MRPLRSALGGVDGEGVFAPLGRRFGLSPGQTSTVVTGALAVLVLSLFGLPPVFRDIEAPFVAAAPLADERGADESVTPTPTVPIEPVVTVVTPTLSPSPLGPVGGSGASPPTSTTPSTTVPDIGPTPVVAGVAGYASTGGLGGVVVADDGTIFTVVDNAPARGSDGASTIVAVAPDGTVEAWPVEGQPAVRTRGLVGVAMDGDGSVVVTDASTSRVLRLDPTTGTIETVATIPDLRSCMFGLVPAPCESGLGGLPPEIGGIAGTDDGGFLVADRTQGVVWRVSDGEVAVFVSIDDRLPGEGPVDVALLGNDRLIVATSGRLATLPPGLPALFRVSLAGGRVGTPVAVHDFALGQTPFAVDAGRSERLYVSIPSSGVVSDIGLDFGDVVPIRPDGVEPGFAGPSGVTVIDGGLVVTNQRTTERGWPVHRLPNPDQPRKERLGP